MANLKFTPNSTVLGYDMVQARLDFPALLNSYSSAILTSSEISLRTSASNRTVLDGDNLTYTTNGGKLDITGGTITGIDIRIGSTTKLIEITDLNLDAGEFGDLLNAGSVISTISSSQATTRSPAAQTRTVSRGSKATIA
jgi:hypothetical protein